MSEISLLVSSPVFYPLLVRFRLKLGDARLRLVVVAAEFSVPRMYETRIHVRRIGGCPNDVHWIGKADRLKSIMLGEDREGTGPWPLSDWI